MKTGRECVKDEPRSGRPSIELSEEDVNTVAKVLMEDTGVYVRCIAAEVKMSVRSIETASMIPSMFQGVSEVFPPLADSWAKQTTFPY